MWRNRSIWGNGTHFQWHMEESCLFHLSRRFTGMPPMVYCQSRSCLLQPSFMHHLLHTKCSLRHIAFCSVWLGFLRRHLKKLYELFRIQRQQSSNSGLLAPNLCISWSTTSTFCSLGRHPSLWTQSHPHSAPSRCLFVWRLHILDESREFLTGRGKHDHP